MSKFLSGRLDGLKPYVPGEQPQDMQYVKLNTNESPFPPSPKVFEALTAAEADKLRLYPDPENRTLVTALAGYYGVNPDEVFVGNGSDEVLAFAFMSFFDGKTPARYTDISYGFYPVYCDLFGVEGVEVPLKADYTVDVDALISSKDGIVLANPNAPTGIALSRAEIERIAASDKNRLVIVDEAYVDFGAESAVPLTEKYDNLLVIGTFSKSRQLAGARLGFAIGDAALIADLKAVKYSFNSYNVNRLTEVMAAAALADDAYFKKCTAEIVENREYLTEELQKLGFKVLPSSANFIFASAGAISGERLYAELKSRGVLVRYFGKPRLTDFVRITVGDREQTEVLLRNIKDILKGE